MATFTKTELVLEHKFDPSTCRHTINGDVTVLHCHHYATLYTQLAMDCGMLDAKTLLAEVAEDIFSGVLSRYYAAHAITGIADRVSIAEQYYAASGLGKMKVDFVGPDSAQVSLLHSHVDEGWVHKWGKHEAPVNYMTSGFVAGMLSAILDRPGRSFSVTETASIVAGAERSKFEAVAK